MAVSREFKGSGKLAAVKPSGKREESFFELVFEVALQIPPGRVTSYGAIASCLGTRLSARMVGWAMNAVHSSATQVPGAPRGEPERNVNGQVSF